MIPVTRCLQVLFVAGLTVFSTGGLAQPAKPVLYYIPHTHWEGAVFKTREEYLEVGLAHILKALQLLKQYPEYKFTLDQVAYIRPFLERYPEEAGAFRQFVAEGRLGIVGGMDVMPDVVKPGGEMFVRQMIYGKRFCREQLGVDVTVAWLLDTFGHHPQMPQLLREAGFRSFWFCRGVPRNEGPSEFSWQGIDGTRIPAVWLPGFYGLFYGPPRELPKFAEFFQRRFDGLAPHARDTERVGLAGVDVSEPEDYVPPLITQFNQDARSRFTIRPSIPTEFEAIVARRSDLTVVTNEFSPIFQGTYSSRIELKQLTRELERVLLRAENMSAFARFLGAPVQDSLLARGWEPVLFNQTHDLASGVMTDHVYEDTMRSDECARRVAQETIEDGWATLVKRIDTSGDGIPIVVFNPLSWARSDVAQVEVGFGTTGFRDVELIDAAGTITPVQLVQVERGQDESLTRAEVVFVAKDVPALGYTTYHLIPRRSEPAAAPATSNEANAIENEFYRVTCDLSNGSLTSVWDKSLQWEALASPANVISREVDKGDLWELYRGLDGGSYIAMTNRQAVPKPGSAHLSNESTGKLGTIQRGAVFSEFKSEHPFAGSDFSTRVRLYAGLRRVDVATELVNHEKYVRYQALFPTTVNAERNAQEIPFGAVERPSGIEFPAQYWVDQTDGRHGLALLNVGLPGNTVTDGTIMLSLLRSHNLGAYGFGGGYEPGMSSESGFQLGKPLTFQYALVPHGGDWRQAQIYRAGFEFNQPLLARKADRHAGALPSRWGLLQMSGTNIVMTAFKPGPDGSLIVRCYEAAGQATPGVRLSFNGAVSEAQQANLMEDNVSKLEVANSALALDFHPFEIKTLKLRLRSPQN